MEGDIVRICTTNGCAADVSCNRKFGSVSARGSYHRAVNLIHAAFFLHFSYVVLGVSAQ